MAAFVIPVAALALGGFVLNQAWQAVVGLFPPVGHAHRMATNRMWPVLIPTQPELAQLRRQGYITQQQYLHMSSLNGHRESVANMQFQLTETKLNLGDYLTLWRRGVMSHELLHENAQTLGYTPSSVEMAKEASRYYPSPQDLILFAVRDTYDPKAVADFGLGQDLPSAFVQAAEKIGISREWAEKLWQSHWRLPSMTQGFEMFHRDVIDKDQLKLLMKAQDIVPGWRDKLIQISYRTLTRVDVRRMFRIGVLDRAGVIRAYKDLGYSQEGAENMADFTEKSVRLETAGLSRGAIVKAYKEGHIDERTMRGYFEALGYSADVVNLYASLAVAEKAQDEVDELVKELTAQFELGMISINGIRQALVNEGMETDQITVVMARIEKARSRNLKLPSRTDLENWLKARLISEEQFFADMQGLGYMDRHIRIFLTEARLEQEDDEVKYLSADRYAKWLKKGIMTEDEFRAVAAEINVSPADINRFIREATGS